MEWISEERNGYAGDMKNIIISSFRLSKSISFSYRNSALLDYNELPLTTIVCISPSGEVKDKRIITVKYRTVFNTLGPSDNDLNFNDKRATIFLGKFSP